MENKDGALAFDVLIRDNNLEQMLSKDEQRIAQFTQNVEDNSQSIVNSFGSIGKAVGGIAVGAMLQSWVSDIVSVRGEFQQLEIAFTTMLGNAEKSTALMRQITDTAATTPFDLKGVANGAKQLLAYGESADTVNNTLVRLGDLASGLSLPLNDLVYLYGTTMVQGRLFTQDVRQFMGRGIPLVQELSKELGKTTEEINQMVTDGKIGFPEVQKVIENLTNSGGMFYNLMAEQSQSLTGQVSNLGDAWDMMLNEMGQSSEGVLSSGIGLATTLVENYDTVLNVLGGIITAYGTYKAAVVALAVAQNRSTGFATIDNVVAKARMGIYSSLTIQTQNYTKQNELMTKAQQAYTLELQKSLTMEQQESVLHNLKLGALQGLLTAQQQVYLSRLNLNTQSVEYIAAAESILTVDQKLSLQKQQLGRDSMAYSVAIENEVRATQAANASEIAKMQIDARKLKEKQALLLVEYRASLNKIEQTRIEISLSKLNSDALTVENLKLQQHNQLKAHAAIVTDMKNTKAAQEALTTRITTTATQQATVAGQAKVASDTMQVASSSMLSTATTFLTAKLKALWATMLANPFTAILSLVGLVISAFVMFRKEEEQSIDVAKEFESQTKKEIESVNMLKAVLQNTTAGTETHKKALEKLNGVLTSYNMEVIKEGDNIQIVTEKYNELTQAINKNTAERLLAQRTEKATIQQSKEEEEALEKLKDKVRGIRDSNVNVGGMGGTYMTYTIPEWVSQLKDEYFQYIYDEVKARMLELEDLPVGSEAYNKKLQEIQKVALKMMADATGEAEKEIGRSSKFVENFVNSVAVSTQKANADISATKDGLESMAGGLDGKNKTKEEIDLMTLSLENLHKKAEELNGQKVTLEFGSIGFNEVQTQLDAVNAAIGKKQGELNTETSINDEIKRLKSLREGAAIGGDNWANYDKQIKSLQKKLPDTDSAANKRASAARDVAKSEIEIQLELEESKISVIKDGYARRVAEVELQHRRELARIDREEKELALKYKEAGKKMPTETTEAFNTMRTNENASYEVSKSELLDVQLEEQKKQYEIYYKWVSAYGDNVANSQFADLIANGKTYTDWLKSQISVLESKRASGADFTEVDGNQLITLKTEYNEVTGVKTEMDKFTESISNAKEQSKSLSEYMAKLANMKQDLQLGNTGLIGEERATAIKQVDDEIQRNSEELQQKLLETYRTNAQLRLDAETQYEEEIFWLKQNGFNRQAELAEKAKIRTLAEIDATRIQSSNSWQDLFDNAAYLSSSAFDEVVKGLRAQVEAIEDTDIKEALRKQLEGLEEQTQGHKNPFKQLIKNVKDYKAATDDISKQTSLTKAFGSVADSIDLVKGSFDAVVGGLTELGLAGDEVTQELLGDISNMMGGAAQLAAGISTGDPMAIIQGGVGLITSAISIFDSTSRRIKREMKEHEKQLGLLQRAYSQIQFDVDNAVGENYYNEQERAIENLKKQKAEYEALARLEASKKSKDRDDNKVNEYLANAEQAQRDIETIEREITESLIQTNFKDLANDLAEAWADAFGSMEDSAESFDEIWNKTIANAVKNSLKLKIIEPVINEFTEALATHMGANNNSVAGFNFDYWKRMLQNAGDAFTQGLEGFEEYFQDIADEIDDSTLEGQVKSITEETGSKLAGEITAMRIRQVEHLLISKGIKETTISIQGTLREAVTHLNTIATNTGYNKNLVEIKQYLLEMKDALSADSLRAKGYNI